MLTTLPAFLAASLAVELTPGPNMGSLAVIAAGRGRAAGLAMVAGIALGLATVGAVAALGLGGIVMATPWLYEALRWGGFLFLVWLAWEGWHAADVGKASEAAGPQAGLWQHFRNGFIINTLNPKAAAFFLAILPGFAGESAPMCTIALLTALYVGVATLVHVGIVIAAGAAVPLLVTDDRARRRFSRAMALMLLAVAVWMLAASARG